MFNTANKFNQNINSWQTGSVKRMTRMFQMATSFNQNIDSWQLESVEENGFADMFNMANPGCTSIATCGN